MVIVIIKYRYSKKFDKFSPLILEIYKATMGYHFIKHAYVVKGTYIYMYFINDISKFCHVYFNEYSSYDNKQVIIKNFWKFTKGSAYKKVRYLYKPQSLFADDSKVTDCYTTYTTTDAPIKENKFHMFKHKNKTINEIVDCLGGNASDTERSTATFNVTSEVAPVSFEDQIAHLKEDMAFDVDNPKYQRIKKLVDNFEKQRYNLNSLKGKDD